MTIISLSYLRWYGSRIPVITRNDGSIHERDSNATNPSPSKVTHPVFNPTRPLTLPCNCGRSRNHRSIQHHLPLLVRRCNSAPGTTAISPKLQGAMWIGGLPCLLYVHVSSLLSIKPANQHYSAAPAPIKKKTVTVSCDIPPSQQRFSAQGVVKCKT